MLLGKIVGKITPTRFKFQVHGEARLFEYIQVYHKDYDYVLCQIVEIEKDSEDTIAHAVVIGYRNENGQVKSIRSPFEPGCEVLLAEDDFLRSIIKLKEQSNGAFIGRLEGRQIDIRLNLRELLTKHVAVLAKSGAGKSYTVGVLLEEIIQHKVPLLIIDPHGEYSSLRYPNEDENDLKRLALFKLKAKGFKQVMEFGDQSINENVRPLLISEDLTADELIHMLPGKVTSVQLGLLHSALQGSDRANFSGVLSALAVEENNAKWNLIHHIEHLQHLRLFSQAPIDYEAMIVPGQATIINLKGIAPEVQELIVYKLMKDLFEMRKKDKVPPFFTVIEEAHNYCPERSFGETKCSKILRTVASEGRKFGLGLCIVSQRPARVDKSILSQCTTQMILKMTNPNDLKAVTSSVEGINSESEHEIQSLPIGNALVTGVVDLPLFVEIRPRLTKHGGIAAEMMKETDMVEKLEEFEDKEILPLIMPKMTKKDIELMGESKVKKTTLIPAVKLNCRSSLRQFSLCIELIEGGIVTSIEKRKVQKKFLPPLFKLSKPELSVLEKAVRLRRFTREDLISKTGPDKIFESALVSLADKKLIMRSKDAYEINPDFVFSTLDKLHFPYKVEYNQAVYDEKLEAARDIESMSKEISRFTEVVDNVKCWIVHYELESQ